MKKTLIAVAISASLSSVAFGYQVPECKPNDFKCLNDRLDTIEGSLYYQVDNRLGDNRRDINKIGDALETKFSNTYQTKELITNANVSQTESLQKYADTAAMNAASYAEQNSLVAVANRYDNYLGHLTNEINNLQQNSVNVSHIYGEIDKVREVVGLSTEWGPANPKGRLDRRFDRVVEELNTADWNTIIAGEGGATVEQLEQMHSNYRETHSKLGEGISTTYKHAVDGQNVAHAAREAARSNRVEFTQMHSEQLEHISLVDGRAIAAEESASKAYAIGQKADAKVVDLTRALQNADWSSLGDGQIDITEINNNITAAHANAVDQVQALYNHQDQQISGVAKDLEMTRRGIEDMHSYHVSQTDIVNKNLTAINDHFQTQIDQLNAATGGVTVEQAQDLYEHHEGRIDGVRNEIKDVHTYADSIKYEANMAYGEAREAQQGVSVVMDRLRSADWERTAGVTDLRAELKAANWDELKGDGQIDMTETNNNITAAHANAVEQAQAMNAQLMSKLEAMQAQIDALQKPTNPQPPVDNAAIQARYEADMKQLAQKIHNDYQSKIAALEDKVNNIKPSVPTNPEHSAAIRTSYENDLKAVYNAAVAASTPSQPVDGLDKDDVQGMIDSAVSANSFAIDSVMAEMDEVKGGVAMAIATASMPQAIDADTTVISAGLGHFGGQNAVSVGMSHRYERVTINGSVSTDTETFSVGAGVGYSW